MKNDTKAYINARRAAFIGRDNAICERDEARRIARALLAALREADKRLILSAEWREEDRDEYNIVRDPVAYLLPSQDSILP